MYRLAEIKTLLRKHDYLPIVRKMGDGIIAKFPSKQAAKRLVEAYAVQRGSAPGLFYNSSLSISEKFISIPEYAIRPFIAAGIVACCDRVSIHWSLVRYEDEEGEEGSSWDSIVDPPSIEAERSREHFLATLFQEAKKDGFPVRFEQVAVDHSVYDGYKLMQIFSH